MTIELPKLPYAMDELAPVLSKETLEFKNCSGCTHFLYSGADCL